MGGQGIQIINDVGALTYFWPKSLFSFRLSDHLYAMFDTESPSWDTERKYQVASIEVQRCTKN